MGEVPEPVVVEYDPITGVPSEFNEFLPQDCPEYKKWKAAVDAGVEGDMAGLSVTEKTKDGEEIEKKLPGGKVKKKGKPEVVLERNVRNKRKCITTVTGLDVFKVGTMPRIRYTAALNAKRERERERERERNSDRNRDRQTDRQKQRQTGRENTERRRPMTPLIIECAHWAAVCC